MDNNCPFLFLTIRATHIVCVLPSLYTIVDLTNTHLYVGAQALRAQLG